MAVVLIVDDDAQCGDALARLVSRAVGPAECVSTGEDALAFLNMNPTPKVILLDLMLPAMNGLQVLHELRADGRYQSIPVIVFSGFADATTRRLAIAAGAQEYFVKDEWEQAV